MKIILVVILMLFFVSCGEMPVFAQAPHHKKNHANVEMVYGSVVSMDKDKKEIVIKDEKTKETKAFQVNENSGFAFKPGQKVKLKVKTGSNIAESVKVVHQKKK